MPSSFSALIGTSQRSDFLSKALLVLAGTAVLALAAHVKVPFWPVPMTMQTVVVLLIGAAYGPTLAAATLITYLVEGALGHGAAVPPREDAGSAPLREQAPRPRSIKDEITDGARGAGE